MLDQRLLCSRLPGRNGATREQWLLLFDDHGGELYVEHQRQPSPQAPISVPKLSVNEDPWAGGNPDIKLDQSY
jgi:hypothetical protein